jgi:hypothetical protein
MQFYCPHRYMRLFEIRVVVLALLTLTRLWASWLGLPHQLHSELVGVSDSVKLRQIL